MSMIPMSFSVITANYISLIISLILSHISTKPVDPLPLFRYCLFYLLMLLFLVFVIKLINMSLINNVLIKTQTFIIKVPITFINTLLYSCLLIDINQLQFCFANHPVILIFMSLIIVIWPCYMLEMYIATVLKERTRDCVVQMSML